MDAYERLRMRLRTNTGARPRTTFEKKLSILKGEVFFLDKDLLMGADHGHAHLHVDIGAMQLSVQKMPAF